MNARCWLMLGLAGWSALIGAPWSRAENVIVLPDPTRPPSAVLRAMSAKNGTGPAAAPAAPAAQAASDAASGASSPSRPVRHEPRLTSVRVGTAGDSVALVDGRLVQLGDRVGDSTVALIDDDGVVLRGPKGTQRLSLTPAASKRWPGMDSPAKGGGKETR